MNTFWGCETEALTELSAVFARRTGHLRTVLRTAAQQARTVAWSGPDAEEHRRRTEELLQEAAAVLLRLQRLGEQLGEEAEEQETCSQPEPGFGGPQGWGPMIGGPFTAEGPTDLIEPMRGMTRAAGRLAERLRSLPEPEGGWGPMLGGPLQHEGPLAPIPAPRPVPEGEDLALDPETVAEAEGYRRQVLGAVPLVGTAQTLMGVHESEGEFLDRAQQGLEDSGLGVLTPALAVPRTMHAVSGVALGEESILAHTFSGIDRSVANTLQTAEEISSAIGDGDLAGAVGAVERSAFRQAEVTADVLTATAVPALAGATSEVLGIGADVTETLSPEAAARLREGELAADRAGQDWEAGRERLTDAERYYDLRRQHAPMPWDRGE